MEQEPSRLQANYGFIFESGKTYTHSVGLSCAFRQWRATHSHCRFLHGYALQVTITFRSVDLDERNWVFDFGGLKGVKEWLQDKFDHKTLVARDDPELITITSLAEKGILDPIIVDHVGCEYFAKMIFEYVQDWLPATMPKNNVVVHEVEVREHDGNFARYRRLGDALAT